MTEVFQIFNASNYTYSIYCLPTFLITALSLALGLTVFTRERGSFISFLFLTITLCTAVWLFSFSWMYCANKEAVALLWAKGAYLGIPFLPAATYHFTTSTLQINRPRKTYAWAAWTVSFIFSIGALFSNLLVSSVYKYWWGYYPLYGWLGIPFLTYFAAIILACLYLYFSEYLKTNPGVVKKRIGAFLLAFIIAYLGSVDYLPKYKINIYPFGYLAVFIFLSISARAIWRYRLVGLTPAFAAEQILEILKGAVFVVDIEGYIRVLNRASCRMLGYEEKELLGKPIGSFFESYSVVDASPARVSRGEALHDHIMVWKAKDGHRLDVSISTSVLMDKSNTAVGVVYSAYDLIELKAAEQEVRRAQAFLNSIVENIPNMLFVKDAKDLRFVRFNRAGEQLLGYLREELMGKNDYNFFPKEQADFFTQKDRHVLEGKKLEDIPEEPIMTRDKGERILHTKKIPILNEQGEAQYLLGISEDITEKKKAEEELIKKTMELARSNAEREQLQLFTYVASHDLREPLQKIMGFGDLLKSHCAEGLGEKGKDYLDRMQNATLRMNQLIEDILKFSRVTTEGDQFQPVDLRELVSEVLVDLEVPLIDSKGKVEVGNLPLISADRSQMHQLFQNLIANALKFHKKGEVPSVVIKSRALDGGFAEITVQDNGIGFDEKYLEKIFRPFERLHGRAEYQGSGIGLAICQKIVVRHHGKITAKSTPGKGTIFIITLPI